MERHIIRPELHAWWGYKLTGTHLVPVSPAQFSSGQISAISDRATNYLYGSPIYGASVFLSQEDRRHVAISFDRFQPVRCRRSVLWLRSVCRRQQEGPFSRRVERNSRSFWCTHDPAQPWR